MPRAAREASRPRSPQEHDMPTKSPAGSAQMQRKTAVIDDIKARLASSERNSPA